MIPVPASGVLESVEGEEKARATSHIVGLEITARCMITLLLGQRGRVTWDFCLRERNRRMRWRGRCGRRMGN